eukprot:446418-Prymnesium_polylepis.1
MWFHQHATRRGHTCGGHAYAGGGAREPPAPPQVAVQRETLLFLWVWPLCAARRRVATREPERRRAAPAGMRCGAR